jgi:hypothetical protein
MSEIRHRIGIAAPKERVYEALATVTGCRHGGVTPKGTPRLAGG